MGRVEPNAASLAMLHVIENIFDTESHTLKVWL